MVEVRVTVRVPFYLDSESSRLGAPPRRALQPQIRVRVGVGVRVGVRVGVGVGVGVGVRVSVGVRFRVKRALEPRPKIEGFCSLQCAPCRSSRGG